MRKVVACIVARTVSTRLPLKVLRQIDSENTLLDFIIKRMKFVAEIDDIYICTSAEPVDDILEDVATRNSIKIYRGSADEVTERLISVANIEKATDVLRITGDNPFTNYEYLSEQINQHFTHSLEYSKIIGAPFGGICELINVDALKRCIQNIDPKISEYLTLFIFEPQKFKCGVFKLSTDYSDYTLTVDYPEDLVRTKAILEKSDNGIHITLAEIVEIISTYKISNSYVNRSGEVKLPHNKTVSYDEFLADLQKRAELSHQFKLEPRA